MKYLFRMVLFQLNCAFAAAVVFMPIVSSPAMADALADAIKISEGGAEAPLVSREVFARRSQLREVRLSPDGKHLAYRVEHGKIQQLWTLEIDVGSPRQLFSSKFMENIRWSKDSQFVFMQSKQGISVAPLAINASPAFIINLDRDEEQYGYGVDNSHPHGYIVSLLSDDGQSHSINRILPDGTRQQLYKSNRRAVSFLQNASSKTQVVKRIKAPNFEVVRVVSGEESLLFTCDILDTCDLVGLDANTDTILIRARFGNDLTALYEVNMATGSRQKLHGDPQNRHDIFRVQLNVNSGAALLASYEDDYLSTYGLTAAVNTVLAEIKARVHSQYAYFLPSVDQNRWLIVDANPAGPSMRYYIYDVSTKQVSQPLAGVMEALEAEKALVKEANSAVRVAVYYSVSDGMLQQGYVTLPRGKNLRQVPLVVNPHGGPWSRTKGGYSQRAQFFANRGYAVFEPNFRASTGFGRTYVESANRDFGDGRVQQDIIDGLRYILSRGIGSEDKLAIVGHSFGGYSVLGALAFTPDLFKVGVAGAPPADLVETIRNFMRSAKTDSSLMRYENFRQLTVDLDRAADVERLSLQSPDRHWRAVTKPLYIWAGGEDPKVNILNVREYALRHHRAGKPTTFMVDPNAGHSPIADIQIEAYFYMMEKALAGQFEGRQETDISQKLARYLKRSVVIDNNNFTPEAVELGGRR